MQITVLRSESAMFTIANQVTAAQLLEDQVVQPHNLSGPMPHSKGIDMSTKRCPPVITYILDVHNHMSGSLVSRGMHTVW